MSKTMKTITKLRFPEFRDAPEWEEKAFGDAATFYNGRAYKQEELLDSGKYRVLRVGNFFTNEHWYYSDLELDENKYCDNGDLLYAWSASFAPKIWTGEKVIYHYHIWKVVEHKGVNKKFLFILLDYETEKMKRQSANGLGLLHITKGTIEAWKCNFPNFKEQQKIADCLGSVDELITTQSAKVEALKAHKKALMQQLFPVEGETTPRLRFPEFQNAPEWEEKPLQNIADFVNKKIALSVLNPKKYISTENILQDFEGLKETNTLPPSGSATEFLVNDILVSNIRPYLKKICVAEFDGGASNDVIVIRASDGIHRHFLSYILKNDAFIDFVMAGAKGVKMPRGDTALIKQYPVLVPQEPKEQQKIADCLSSIDELIASQNAKVEALKTHKKALMQQLFPSLDKVKI